MTSPHLTTGADLERALSAAEETLATVQSRRNRLVVLSSMSYLLTAIVVTAAVAVSVALPSRAWGVAISSLAALGALGGLAAGSSVLVERRRQLRAQERVMIAAINRIREVLPLVVARERWSSSQEETMLARIARFPIVAD